MKDFIKVYFEVLKWILIFLLMVFIMLIPFTIDNKAISGILMILIIPLECAIASKIIYYI